MDSAASVIWLSRRWATAAISRAVTRSRRRDRAGRGLQAGPAASSAPLSSPAAGAQPRPRTRCRPVGPVAGARGAPASARPAVRSPAASAMSASSTVSTSPSGPSPAGLASRSRAASARAAGRVGLRDGALGPDHAADDLGPRLRPRAGQPAAWSASSSHRAAPSSSSLARLT